MTAKKSETKTTTKILSLNKSEEPKSTEVKTFKHAARYIFVGITITIFNFVFYSLLANIIINNNDLLWLSSLISTTASIIVAYILHSKITWKERGVTKTTIAKFFIWNILLAIAIGPWLTQLFSLITPLYEFAFNITNAIHLPFSYEFVLTTGVFALTSLVVMILNFFFYDRFVFGKPKNMIE